MTTGISLLSAMALAAPALAQDDPPPASVTVEPVAPPPAAAQPVEPAPGGTVEQPVVVQQRERKPLFDTSLEVGFGDFTGSLGGRTSVGPAYGVRVGFTLWKFMSMAARYRGSIHAASAGTGIDNDSLMTNGIDASLRVAPFAFLGITPYGFAGIGAMHVASVVGGPVTNNFDSGWAGQVPVGGGLQITPVRWLGLGAEASYNFLFSEQFVPVGMGATNDTNMWNVAFVANIYL
jgi:hypothetical protein